MNSYKQIPVGIPVSQNPYPLHPYTKNFPEEPESESLHANPQQYYPSQGQGKFTIGQPIQSYGPSQAYNQPAQYVVVGSVVASDPGKKKLERKIRDLEGKLDKGWYHAYYTWLFSMAVGAALLFIQSLILFCFLLGDGEFGVVPIFIMGDLLMANCVWFIQQTLVVKNAMNGKNLEAARRGLISMTRFAVFYFVSLIVFIGLLDYLRREHDSGPAAPWYLLYLAMLIFAYVTPVWINIFGAKKVIGLLENREALILQCKTNYGSVSLG